MPMSITVVGSANNKNAESTTVITLTSAVAAGDAILVYAGHDSGGGTITSVADASGNTYSEVGNTALGDLHNVAFLSQSGQSLSSGAQITVTWGASPPKAKQIFVASISGLAANAFYSWWRRSGTGPNVTNTAFNTPDGEDCLVAVLGAVEAPAGEVFPVASGYTRIASGGTSGQGSASNVNAILEYIKYEPSQGSQSSYFVNGGPSEDYLYSFLVLKGQPLVIQNTTRTTSWRVKKATSRSTSWGIPYKVSAETSWGIGGDGSYIPSPVLIESVTTEEPLYEPTLLIYSNSVLAVIPTVLSRQFIYPDQLLYVQNYSGGLGDIAEWVLPGSDPTWLLNTAVGQTSHSQFFVDFPAPQLQPADNQIFHWTARKSASEAAPQAVVWRGWAVDGPVQSTVQTATVGASPVTVHEFIPSSDWTPTTIVEFAFKALNNDTNFTDRGAWEPGAVAWELVYEDQPEPGREIFVLSRSIQPAIESYTLSPVIVSSNSQADYPDGLLIESVSHGPDVAEISPLMIRSDSGPTAEPALLINSVARADGQQYDPATIAINSETVKVEIDIQLLIRARAVERADPELEVDSTSALPTNNPSLLVESATSEINVSIELQVSSSARGSAVYPGAAQTLEPYLEVNGVDLSGRLTGPWRVTREEGRAAVAEINLLPAPGPLDVNDAIRSAVRFGYKIGGGSPVILFSGVVDDPAFDPQTGMLTYTCTDNLPRVIGKLNRGQIDSITPGAYWSDAVYDAEADSWEYAQNRMETTPASLDLSIDGGPRFHAWAAAAIPHFTFRDNPATGNFVDRTLRLSQASWREFVNEIEVGVEVRYQRRVHREIGYRWTYTPTFQGYLNDTTPLPTEDTIRNAVEQAGWSIKYESFTRLPGSGVYYGIIWTHDPDQPPFWVLEANLTLAKRWDEVITERAYYTVRAPASIARFGPIKEEDRVTYQPDAPADTEAWLDKDLDQTASSGGIYSLSTSNDLDGFVTAPGGVSYKDDVNQSLTDAATMVGLSRAARRIFESHRQSTAEVTAPLLPEIDVIHTAEIQATGIVCKGKVREVIHQGDCDISAFPPQTTVRIALSQCDAGASIVPTPLAPVSVSVPAPDVIDGQVLLGSSYDMVHLGNRWYSPPEDETWSGWVTNYTIPNPVGAEKYDERFVVDVGDYEREPVEVANSATFDLHIPHDSLTTTA